jgi:pimeloyl-ACP methyl ester carboxylesterase
MGAPVSHRDISFTAPDGLALHGRDYPASDDATPILCLCGLTRNVRDFEPLASWLAGRRRLITMDYRGRGRSAYAADPMTYRPDIELGDALALLDHLGIERVSLIGTSRGGSIAMLMAAQAPHRLKSVLLNDVGAVIEKAALMRIAGYVGKPLDVAEWPQAVRAIKETNLGFDTLSEGEWLSFARRLFVEKDGHIRHDYDLRLAQTMPAPQEIDKQGVPDLWAFFDALAPFPATVLRAEHSDLLSAATVSAMAKRHPRLTAHVIKDRGHVPFLDEADSRAAIEAWLETA